MVKGVGSCARIAVINLMVFLGLILTLNLLASPYIDGRYLWKKIFVPYRSRRPMSKVFLIKTMPMLSIVRKSN